MIATEVTSGLTILSRPRTVYLHEKATGGDGSAGSPYTGWDTAITWQRATYRGENGATFQYPLWPMNVPIQGIRLEGEGAILKYTGGAASGANKGAVYFNAAGIGNGVSVYMQDWEIDAGESVDTDTDTGYVGVYTNFINHGLFENILVRNAARAFDIVFGVCTDYTLLRCSINIGGGPRNCVDGIVVRGTTSDIILTQPVIEGFWNHGLWLQSPVQNVKVNGGTCEGSFAVVHPDAGLGIGVKVDAGCQLNGFYGMDIEANKINVVDNGNSYWSPDTILA